MKRTTLSLALSLGLALAGCTLRGNPRAKTPAPPSPSVARTTPAETRPADSAGEPLSIPQTQVRLPKPQPIDPEALATQPVMLPDPPPALVNPTVPRARRAPTAAQAKPETPDAAADASHPAEAPRARIEPLLPADERRQLIEETDKRLRQAEEMVDRLSARPLNNDQRSAIERIRSFTKQSRQALDRSETQQAVELADRAWLLAQELERAK